MKSNYIISIIVLLFLSSMQCVHNFDGTAQVCPGDKPNNVCIMWAINFIGSNPNATHLAIVDANENYIQYGSTSPYDLFVQIDSSNGSLFTNDPSTATFNIIHKDAIQVLSIDQEFADDTRPPLKIHRIDTTIGDVYTGLPTWENSKLYEPGRIRLYVIPGRKDANNNFVADSRNFNLGLQKAVCSAGMLPIVIEDNAFKPGEHPYIYQPYTIDFNQNRLISDKYQQKDNSQKIDVKNNYDKIEQLIGTAQPYLMHNGSNDKTHNILIVPEGFNLFQTYCTGEFDPKGDPCFDPDARHLIERLWETHPFNEYMDHFKIYGLKGYSLDDCLDRSKDDHDDCDTLFDFYKEGDEEMDIRVCGKRLASSLINDEFESSWINTIVIIVNDKDKDDHIHRTIHSFRDNLNNSTRKDFIAVSLNSRIKRTDFHLYTLAHELGHTFQLGDNYCRGDDKGWRGEDDNIEKNDYTLFSPLNSPGAVKWEWIKNKVDNWSLTGIGAFKICNYQPDQYKPSQSCMMEDNWSPNNLFDSVSGFLLGTRLEDAGGYAQNYDKINGDDPIEYGKINETCRLLILRTFAGDNDRRWWFGSILKEEWGVTSSYFDENSEEVLVYNWIPNSLGSAAISFNRTDSSYRLFLRGTNNSQNFSTSCDTCSTRVEISNIESDPAPPVTTTTTTSSTTITTTIPTSISCHIIEGNYVLDYTANPSVEDTMTLIVDPKFCGTSTNKLTNSSSVSCFSGVYEYFNLDAIPLDDCETTFGLDSYGVGLYDRSDSDYANHKGNFSLKTEEATDNLGKRYKITLVFDRYFEY